MIERTRLSQRGFSIIQGMVLAGAVAGMAYVGTMLTTNQKLAQKGNESKTKVEQLHALIYSTLQNKDHCTETLKKNLIIPAPTDCYADNPSSHSACTALGGSPGASHPFGQGPCYTPLGPGPDTACLTYSEMGQPSCSSYTLCHGLTPVSTLGTMAVQTIWTKGSVSPLFVYRSFYHATRDMLYMNNSVAINSMELTIPTDLTQHANLKITYGKLEDTNSRARSGKGFGGKDFAKNIKIKLQTNPFTKFYESCYAVDENENQNMIKDFCEGLGADGDPSTPNLFEWSSQYQRCVLKDIQCPSGEIFTGFDSNGLKQCHKIQDWMNFSDLLDMSTANTCNATTSSVVKFVIVGNKVQIQCNGGGGGTSCSSACDCPGSFDVCSLGTCVTKQFSCINGEIAKGDASCQWRCNGGGWTCALPGMYPACGSL